MRKRGNPARCCCPPCDTPPQLCFAARIDCCGLPATPEWTVTRGGDTVASGPGASACFALPGLSPGEALAWSVTCGALPRKSGTTVVPACAATADIDVHWTLDEILPDKLFATVTGPDPIVGPGGTWSGYLTYAGTNLDSTGNYQVYNWMIVTTSGGYGYHLGPGYVCYNPNPPITDCVVITDSDSGTTTNPGGQGVGSLGAQRPYGSTIVLLQVVVPVIAVPGGCRIVFAWSNYWSTIAPTPALTGLGDQALANEDTESLAGAEGCLANGWCDNYVCACGVHEEPATFPPTFTAQPPDLIIPRGYYPSYVFNGVGGDFDMTGSDGDLAIACVPVDWSGSAASWGCPGTGGTVHITA